MLTAALVLAATSHPTVAQMRWHRRVLLVAAPSTDDPALAEQRRILAGWDREATDRDLTLVTVVGDRVTGSTDPAAALRRRWRLAARGFTAVLIGKDGGEKLRERHAIDATTLAGTIDAMPMRRAGQR